MALGNLPNEYKEFLSVISSRISNREIWMTGGRLIADELGARYSGDVDTLVAVSMEEFTSRLSEFKFYWQHNLSGAIRISLPDGNHVDVWPDLGFQDERNIIGHLRQFCFSCQSMAKSLLTGNVVRTQENREAICGRILKINSDFETRTDNKFSVVRNFEVLRRYFSFHCDDAITLETIENARKSIGNFLSPAEPHGLLSRIYRLAQNVVPRGLDYYLTRGIVRNALLDQVTPWDDYDILLLGTVEEVEDHLSRNHVPFVRNYFGMPKVLMGNGQAADLLCFPLSDINEALSVYTHNLDQLYWPMRDSEVPSIPQVLEQFRTSEVDGASAGNYGPLKSAFYILLYDLDMTREVAGQVMAPLICDEFNRANACRLARELLCRLPASRLHGLNLDDPEVSPDSALGLIYGYLSVGLVSRDRYS